MQITDVDRKKLNINYLYAFLIVGYIIVAKILVIMSGNPKQALSIFSSISNVFIATFVWIRIDNLSEMHLERATLVLFAVFGILFSRLGAPGEAYLFPIRWLTSVAIIVALITKWKKIPQTNHKWPFIGLVASIPVTAIATMVELIQPQPWVSTNLYPSSNLLLIALREIIYQLSYVTIFEEVIFRGLIWGFLIQAGWSDNKVFWVQAILFWMLHITKTPLTFIITIPLITILFSALAKYSKQVFPGIIAHTILNAMGRITLYYYYR